MTKASDQLLVSVQSELQRQGHKVEIIFIEIMFPKTFRIDDGPELTEMQFLQEAGKLLAGAEKGIFE
jgi:cytochrome c biogenesis protein ResB